MTKHILCECDTYSSDNNIRGALLYEAARSVAEKFGLPDLRPEVDNINQGLNQDEFDRMSRSIKNVERDMLVMDHMSKNIHFMFYNHIENNGLSKSLTFTFFKSAVLGESTCINVSKTPARNVNARPFCKSVPMSDWLH